MQNTLRMEINKLSNIFEKSFINDCYELILIPKTNCYFSLRDVRNVTDLKVKFITWVTRDTIANQSKYWANHTKKRYLLYIDKNFTLDELTLIYTKLGNGVNEGLCVDFIKSNYDLDVLKK